MEFLDCDQSDFQEWLPYVFPDQPIPLPSIQTRTVNSSLPNPFEDDQPRFPSLRTANDLPEHGGVNGYIKFRMRATRVEKSSGMIGRGSAFSKNSSFSTNDNIFLLPGEAIPKLPPNFGRGLRLDNLDNTIMQFCMLRL